MLHAHHHGERTLAILHLILTLGILVHLVLMIVVHHHLRLLHLLHLITTHHHRWELHHLVHGHSSHLAHHTSHGVAHHGHLLVILSLILLSPQLIISVRKIALFSVLTISI